jgi:hypothetical protein
MMAGRYAHAKQFNRHRRQLRILRTRLGRLIRDIRRKITGHADFEAAFAWPLSRADQIRSQQQRQRGWKLYSFHAPEVECTGKGKASAPYGFGVKASIVTTNAQDRRPRGLRGGIRLATLAGRSDPLAAATPARLEALFLPRCVFISGPKARGLRPHQTRAQTSLRHPDG